MAEPVPAALRQADVNIWKCATRAAEFQRGAQVASAKLEQRNLRRIMAYWCHYWAVQQILARNLQSTDEDIRRYTESVVKVLEQTMAKYANKDATEIETEGQANNMASEAYVERAITDDTAGQSCVKQYAQRVLDQGELDVEMNTVTLDTAKTFEAAATFFHVCNVWGPLDQETQQKIKYAKWNAGRILRAIKEGKDPNESNPRHVDSSQPESSPSKSAVQTSGDAPSSTAPRPATVEEVPDSDLVRDAAGVSLPHSPVSPVSEGGLQLPGVPTNLNQPAQSGSLGPETTIPSAPAVPDHSEAAPDLPAPPSGWTQSQPSPVSPPPGAGFYHQPSVPPAAPPTFATSPPSTAAVASPPPPTDSYPMNMAPTAHFARPIASPAAPATSYASVPSGNFITDEAAIVGAQKHARWAISALNFEDVPTAVKELRKALELLGAT
ncbi:vacuolar protein sorting-associated protein vts1 [Achaetomium macrosporum]|uniref:Vacuolar protein sorting-associated protein vts1 n=1 Tax=Achaetomium macrosporum TaxID=79813 RepID=A0AAN7C414_9PEZI|nr:vacuolar protein sorting-associated protein vts1 [Achaetomium macrosporum]